jgi:AraC family transcriptional regulator of adaptative response/methylated-DNA-[protein]-cysteine methyltransferase
MNPQQLLITTALPIAYHAKFRDQPNLDIVAAKVSLSPFHFQRLFYGMGWNKSKKFLQYISVAHAKQLLKRVKPHFLQQRMKRGLSGTSRLHDLFVNIE